MLLRNIIVARTLSQYDIGVGSAFLGAITLFEMMSNVRPGDFIIQDKSGESPALQATGHLLETARGALLCVLLLVSANFFSYWFDVPEALWAFRTLALVPLAKGLVHLDTKRAQRDFRYAPEVWVEVLPQVLATALAWPMARWLGDYSAILWLIVLRVLAGTLLTHAVARRPYRWSLRPDLLRRMLSFGWPLLASGMVLFAILQGDRILIGSRFTHYSLAQLGLYTMAWSTTMAATMLVARIVNPILLPLFSRLQDDHQALAAHHKQGYQLLALLAALSCVPFFLMGSSLMAWLYGEEYRSAGNFIGWLAAAQALRVLRLAPINVSIALGDTLNALRANLFRSSALVVAAWAAMLQADLIWIAAASMIGEIAALMAALYRLRSKSGLDIRVCAGPTGFTITCIIATALLVPLLPSTGQTVAALTCLATLAVMTSAGFLAMPSLRTTTFGLLVRWIRRGQTA